jgi:class 3 adenylate cyclase
MEQTSTEKFDDYLETRADDIENIIHELWVSKDDSIWSSQPYFYIRLGETADKLGQSMFAHDVLREGLEYFPENLRLTQLYALSLIKCGFLKGARQILTDLVKKGHFDEETLGILGRVYKDMWVISGGVTGDIPYLEKSRSYYLQAFKQSRGYYSGINAASMSFMLGEKEHAGRLAKLVLKICVDRMRAGEKRDYWILATMGEGFLLLSDVDNALQYFKFASRVSGKNYSYLASTRKQMGLLKNYTDIGEEIFGLLKPPPVVAFSGHMIDSSGRRPARFPPEIEDDVKKAVCDVLERVNPGIGYSSVACGSDIIFLECMQERKAETNVILPFLLDDFMQTSVSFAGNSWIDRANRTLKRSTQVLMATEGKYSGDDLLFDYANRIIMGKTILRAELLETDPVLIAAWDRKKSRKPGGTYDFINTWEAKGYPLEIIDINKINKNRSKKRSERNAHRGVLIGNVGEMDVSNVPLNSDAASRTAESDPGGADDGGRESDGVTERPNTAESRSDMPEYSSAEQPEPVLKDINRSVKTMLFADLAGFSSLREEQIPFFIKNYLGSVAGSLRNTKHRPIFKNIWGDALYFVFNDLISAAEYALELRDLLKEKNWKSLYLSENLSIRIGLHVGPVFGAKEPILKKINYFGRHVNRAARIEPITNPGNVYASEQFAALLISHPQNRLECIYVGVIVLPKKFGTYPIYLIKRKNEIG